MYGVLHIRELFSCDDAGGCVLLLVVFAEICNFTLSFVIFFIKQIDDHSFHF